MFVDIRKYLFSCFPLSHGLNCLQFYVKYFSDSLPVSVFQKLEILESTQSLPPQANGRTKVGLQKGTGNVAETIC